MADAETPNQEQAPAPTFSIHRLYLKDASLEVPGAPNIFKEAWAPKVQLDVNSGKSKVDEGLYEVVLKITLTASQNDKPAVLIEVHQAGLFVCKGMPEEQIQMVLSTACPDILFPYAREAVDALAVKASFPPFALAPMNFEALYKQALKQQQAQAQADAAVETNH